MATNPYVNKVIYGDQTVIDLTMDTLTASNLSAGVTGHDRSGAPIVGTADYYSPSDTAETTIDDADYFPFYDTSATAKRKSLWSNIKSVLKTYFDTLYAAISHTHTKSEITDFPTLGSAASKDVPTSGNASSSQVVMGDDTRLTDSRTPTSHTHTKSDITDFPTLATVATSGSYSDLSNKPTVDKVKQNTNTTGMIGHNLLATVTSETTAETNYVEKTADMKYYPYYRELQLTDANSSVWTIPHGLAYGLTMGVYNMDAGDTLRFPVTGTDSHIHPDCIAIPISDSKSDGTGYKYRSIKLYNGYAELVLGEDTPAATVNVGFLIYDFTTRHV